MYFQSLQLRLIAAVKQRVRTGELTERHLARLTGISQPHIHNVLKGARILSPEIADLILRHLNLTLIDLLKTFDLPANMQETAGNAGQYSEIPVLEGRIGPGFPFLDRESPMERHPFLSSRVSGLDRPLAAYVGTDPCMPSEVREGDLVLLDRGEDGRHRPSPDGLYAVRIDGRGMIRRVGISRGGLDLFDMLGNRHFISVEEENILNIVRARIVWLGRKMERTPDWKRID